MTKQPITEYVPSQPIQPTDAPDDQETRLAGVREMLRGDMPTDEYIAFMKRLHSVPFFNETLTARMKQRPAPKK